jgi:uncharacterized membrane protein
MADLTSFCAEFGLNDTAVRQVLARSGPAGRQDSPWYIQGIVSLGAWISGLVIIAFGVTLIVVVLEIRDPGGMIALLGIIFFAIGFALLFRARVSLFKEQFAISLSAAGIALGAGGLGVETEKIWVAALMAVLLATLVAWKAPSQSLHSLASALAAALCIASLVEQEVPYFLGLVSLTLVAGALLLMHPLHMELRPTACILLFTGPLVMTLYDTALGLTVWGELDAGGWHARVVHIALFLWLAYGLWLRTTGKTAHIELIAFAATATVLGLIMPPGGSAALVILVLAFVLGSRLLALAGLLLQIYFIVQFYYQLETSLLVKSVVLSAAGAVLLALWGVVHRITAVEAIR